MRQPHRPRPGLGLGFGNQIPAAVPLLGDFFLIPAEEKGGWPPLLSSEYKKEVSPSQKLDKYIPVNLWVIPVNLL